MNNIPRGTSHAKLTRYLLAQAHGPSALHQAHLPQVLFGSEISDSRLDDELSIATLEFSDTPPWLMNQDPSSFPKNTLLGTIWLGVDRAALDLHGRTEFIRAVINSHGRLGPLYAEMLAEFADTDVNIQDNQGRTALHWACVEVLPDMVGLCLSIAEFDTGLRDNDGFTAFDLALRTGHDFLPNLFYSSMLETDETSPQAALLRVLTLSSDESSAENRPLFPGEALFPPVIDRNSPLVVALLSRGVDLTTRDEAGNTVLNIAAGQVDNVDMATRLLNAGSDINAVGNRGFTPLHNAVRSKDLGMVELLVQRKANLLITDNDDVSALDWAVQNGQLGIAHLLQQEGAGVGERDKVGCKVVDVAEENWDIPIGNFLNKKHKLEEPAVPDLSMVPENPDIHVKTPPSSSYLLLAAEEGDIGAVDVPEENRNIHIVKLLNKTHKLEVPALPDLSKVPKNPEISVRNNHGWWHLLSAAENGDLGAVRTLLVQGVDVDAMDYFDRTALLLAIKGRHSEIVKRLLVAGAGTEVADYGGRRPLHSAAMSGQTGMVKELLAAGAETEALGPDRNRPLYSAVFRGQIEIVKELLAAGAEIEAVSYDGDRPLHCAAKDGHTNIVKELLAAGAEIEAVSYDGNRPLHYAAQDGRTNIVKELVAAGAEIEAVGQHGNRPLHSAVLGGHTRVVEELLTAGALSEARNTGGKTAYELALRVGKAEIITMVRAHTSVADRFRSSGLYRLVGRSS